MCCKSQQPSQQPLGAMHNFLPPCREKVRERRAWRINWFKNEGNREKKRERRSSGVKVKVKNVLVCQHGLGVSGDTDGNSSWETNYIAVVSLFFLCMCVCVATLTHDTHINRVHECDRRLFHDFGHHEVTQSDSRHISDCLTCSLQMSRKECRHIHKPHAACKWEERMDGERQRSAQKNNKEPDI